MNEVGDNLLALSYRLVFGALGSYIAARLAPAYPMRHALIMGAIGTVLATLGVVATWNALHLAIAVDQGATLCTLDRRLAEAGQALGLKVELL